MQKEHRDSGWGNKGTDRERRRCGEIKGADPFPANGGGKDLTETMEEGKRKTVQEGKSKIKLKGGGGGLFFRRRVLRGVRLVDAHRGEKTGVRNQKLREKSRGEILRN